MPDVPGAAITAVETGETTPPNAPASLTDLVVPDAGVESAPAQNSTVAVAPVESVHRDTRDAEPSVAGISEEVVATVAPLESAQQDTGKGEQPAVASSDEVANARPEAGSEIAHEFLRSEAGVDVENRRESLAPASTASRTSASCPSALTMMTWASGSAAMISCKASMPLFFGMTMSMVTRSGLLS